MFHASAMRPTAARSIARIGSMTSERPATRATTCAGIIAPAPKSESQFRYSRPGAKVTVALLSPAAQFTESMSR